MSSLLKNKKFLIGVGVLVIVAVVVVVVLLVGFLGKNSNGQLIVDTSNPENAVGLINKFALSTAQNLPVGEVDQNSFTGDLVKLGLPAIQGPVTSVEFSMSLDMQGTSAVKADFTGFVKDLGNSKYGLSFDGKLTNDKGDDLPVSFIFLNDSYYFKLGKIPDSVLNDLLSTTIPSGTDPALIAQYKSYFAKLENQWIKSDANTASQLTGSDVSGATSFTIKDSDKQDLIKNLTDAPLFVNAKAANSRTVGSDTLGCMTMEVNPALDKEKSFSDFSGPLTLCTKGENQLPVLLGMSFTDTAGLNDYTVDLGILSYNKNLPLTEPTGAKSMQEALLGL